jgi:hypothetical protein
MAPSATHLRYRRRSPIFQTHGPLGVSLSAFVRLLVSLACCISTIRASSTTLIAIPTPGAIVVAADGKQLSDGKTLPPARKIALIDNRVAVTSLGYARLGPFTAHFANGETHTFSYEFHSWIASLRIHTDTSATKLRIRWSPTRGKILSSSERFTRLTCQRRRASTPADIKNHSQSQNQKSKAAGEGARATQTQAGREKEKATNISVDSLY